MKSSYLLLFLFSSSLVWVGRGQNVCIIANEIVFTQDVASTNCSAVTNVSLCGLSASVTTNTLNIDLLQLAVAQEQTERIIGDANLQTQITAIDNQQVLNGSTSWLPCNTSICAINTEITKIETQQVFNGSTLWLPCSTSTCDLNSRVNILESEFALLNGTTGNINGTQNVSPCNTTICGLDTRLTTLENTVANLNISGTNNFTLLRADLIEPYLTTSVNISASSGNVIANNVLFSPSGSVTMPVGQTLSAPTVSSSTLVDVAGTLKADTILPHTTSGSISVNNALVSTTGSITLPTTQTVHADNLAAVGTILSLGVAANPGVTVDASGDLVLPSGTAILKANLIQPADTTLGITMASVNPHPVTINANWAFTNTALTGATGTTVTVPGVNTDAIGPDATLNVVVSTPSGIAQVNNVAFGATGTITMPSGKLLKTDDITSVGASMTIQGITIDSAGDVTLPSGAAILSTNNIQPAVGTSDIAIITPVGHAIRMQTNWVMTSTGLSGNPGTTITVPTLLTDAIGPDATTQVTMTASGGVVLNSGITVNSAGNMILASNKFITVGAGGYIALPVGTNPHLDTLDVNTVAMNWQGPSASPTTPQNWPYRMVGNSAAGSHITMNLLAFATACTVSTTTWFSPPLAGAYTPSSNMSWPVFVEDNSVRLTTPGYLRLATDGRFYLFKDYSTTAAWSTTGNCGLVDGISVTWVI